MNSLFCLPRRHLYFTLIFEVYFCWYRIRNLQLFSFNTLKMSIHWVMTAIIFLGKVSCKSFCCLFEWLSFYLWLLLRFLFVFGFNSLTMMYVSMVFFVFVLLEVHRASWICGLITFISFRNFLAIMSSNIASASVSVPSPLRILITQMLDIFRVPYVFFFLMNMIIRGGSWKGKLKSLGNWHAAFFIF